MIEFIEQNWTYIITVGTVLTYLFEKGRTIYLDQKKKKTSYNRLLTALVKLNFSYLKHKQLYSEEPPFNLPDEEFQPILKHLDTFNNDINEFKMSVDKESDINPEILINSHNLFDFVDRFRIVDRINEKETENKISEKERIGIKRAQFYAFEKIFEDFLDEIISDLTKKSTASKTFLQALKKTKTEKYKKQLFEEQKETMKRYYESLKRQGLIPEEIHHFILKNLELETAPKNPNGGFHRKDLN
ncbi:hypothetical protein [Christiangramia sp. SM2212]|uniref:Uncharacterized protein n=1 Tax=Christiangramia sediminicola TaxID=3073267 RepID=A0ABU1ERV2_9FLAO|nr:hypothetical protein [Christiangramia sp. SM2212]MDR5591120.1 hypothetical protein [Christiangramia sp. SM2212]